MDLFNELAWHQFKQLKEVRDLPLNEQVNKYNRYLWELSLARDYYLQYQGKGPRERIITTGFLLQEDLFDLEQEDGSKILITSKVFR